MESIDTSNIKSEDAEDLENDEKQDAEKDVDDSRLIKNDIKVEDLEEQNDVDDSKEVRGFPVIMVTMSIQGLAGYKESQFYGLPFGQVVASMY